MEIEDGDAAKLMIEDAGINQDMYLFCFLAPGDS
jgi:hypothetical protein